MTTMDSLTTHITHNTYPSFTLVSAFMTGINRRKDRCIDNYIQYGLHLLNVDVRQIIFIEYDIFKTHFYSTCRYLYYHGIYTNDCEPPIHTVKYNGTTYDYITMGRLTFVFFEKSHNYLYAYRDLATDFHVNTSYPEKDTIEYMFIQCHKTEWMAIAVSIDAAIFGEANLTGMYAWLDFGIQHMFQSNNRLHDAVYGLRDRISNTRWDRTKIYASSCWGSYQHYSIDIYRTISWVFSGSVFGGSAIALMEFARKTKEKCIYLLTNKHHLMWEVNVWAIIHDETPELFSFFYGNHNCYILDKWFVV